MCDFLHQSIDESQLAVNNSENVSREKFVDVDEFNALKKIVLKQEETIARLEIEQKNCRQNLSHSSNGHALLNEVESRSKRLLPTTQTKYGFTATRRNSGPVHNSAIIVFNNIITNIGSVYNPSTGIFTAHEDGVYVFFFDLECGKGNGDTYGELVRDGSSLGVQVYCHGYGDHDNSSTMGVVFLNTGNSVWVRLYDSDNKTFGYKTIFSGFMI